MKVDYITRAYIALYVMLYIAYIVPYSALCQIYLYTGAITFSSLFIVAYVFST